MRRYLSSILNGGVYLRQPQSKFLEDISAFPKEYWTSMVSGMLNGRTGVQETFPQVGVITFFRTVFSAKDEAG